MVKIERFEDIEAWKKAREIAQQVYSVTCSGDFARDFSGFIRYLRSHPKASSIEY
jgi:hypothetical protein